MKKINIEFGECEHEGDEARYLENLQADPRVASAKTVARDYEEEAIIIQVESDLPAEQIEAIGWGE